MKPTATPSAATKAWKRQAMRQAEVISDAFEVFEAWFAHVANWVLFFCLIGNILQTVVKLGDAVGGTLLCVQCVMLDIAGASLYTMAQQAKAQGNKKGARLALIMSGILLLIMTITALNGTLNTMFPDLSTLVQDINDALIFARLVIVVAYGNIVHQLNTSSEAHETRIETLEAELAARTQERDAATQNGHTQQHAFQQHLNAKEQEVSTLTVQWENGQRELSNLRSEVSTLTVQLEAKDHQLTSLKETMDSGIKWHESNTETLVSSVQSELNRERAKVSSLQEELSILTVQSQSEVSTLRSEVSTLKAERENGQQTVSTLRSEVSTLTVQWENGQRELSNLRVQSQSEVQRLQVQLEQEQRTVQHLQQQDKQGQSEVQRLMVQVEAEHRQVTSLQSQLEWEQGRSADLQSQLERGQQAAEGIVHLDANRLRRSRADAEEKAMIAAIRHLLEAEPGLSGRAIATRVGCSPTTAAKWKSVIEQEGPECVNE